ncbi:MAG: DUF4129 domain-containing protein [Myxococcaceae bacterium]|nr:DUF4129 domain-containing protein [Myxococcaceae bacterium]
MLETGISLALETASVTSSADAQARAQAILGRAEFQPPAPAKTEASSESEPGGAWWDVLERWWQKLLDWLSRADEKRAPRPPTQLPLSGETAAHSLVVLLVGAVVVGLATLLLRARGGTPTEVEAQVTGGVREESLAPHPDSALSRPAEGWAGLADELAAAGRHREAVRNLYLALLARLHRDGAISYETTLSNWDYLRAFRGSRVQRESFRELTSRFDFTWYGHAAVDAEDYASFRALTRIFLAPAPLEAVRA